MMFALQPGSFIVFEGLDSTGKTTAMESFTALKWDTRPHFTHSPSGTESKLSKEIYKLTETDVNMSRMARQFLHLASHSEMYQREIGPKIMAGVPVMLDRCWWSTLAYGWKADEIRSRFTELSGLVTMPTHYAGTRLLPDMVFVFLHPWREDRHNTPQVETNYRNLLSSFGNAIEVPAMNPKATRWWIMEKLVERDLLRKIPA